jgi:hypothetical protein
MVSESVDVIPNLLPYKSYFTTNPKCIRFSNMLCGQLNVLGVITIKKYGTYQCIKAARASMKSAASGEVPSITSQILWLLIYWGLA